MSLARHVDPDCIVASLKSWHLRDAGKQHVHGSGGTAHITPYSTRYASQEEISPSRTPKPGAHSGTLNHPA
ncbi:hypothetical protein B2J93_875 [Marssonina coronariae]|uniref:Uncharacterized protein n=1 Tax=Diplocarpon coronariae TaxID=2795749 RepID=A0A218ZCJ9_9HELO|nr:hypothetical protein JHW43_001982 [Diplocarpon mali]OWP05757.1 hypothetical protein B2J93_875 [Marssonina coronariae]